MAEIVIRINLDKYSIEGEAVLVIDNSNENAPAKGGIRIHQNVSEEEIKVLASEMTKKCILADTPFGGAMAGIRLKDLKDIEGAMYGLGIELAKMDYIPGRWCAAPDVNTNCKAIDAFVSGCTSVKGWRKGRLAATGKTTGIPYELGSTAYGLVLSVEEMMKGMRMNMSLDGASAIVEGTGDLGGNTIQLLLGKGTIICGISDITGAVYKKEGLEPQELVSFIKSKADVRKGAECFSGAEYFPEPDSLLNKEADILVLAGLGGRLNEKTCKTLKVKIICEGADRAYTDQGLRHIVHTKGIITIPSIIASSGGVISSYEEWLLENENLVHINMDEKWRRIKCSIQSRITRNINELCRKMQASKKKTSLECALEMTIDRAEKLRIEDFDL